MHHYSESIFFLLLLFNCKEFFSGIEGGIRASFPKIPKMVLKHFFLFFFVLQWIVRQRMSKRLWIRSRNRLRKSWLYANQRPRNGPTPKNYFEQFFSFEKSDSVWRGVRMSFLIEFPLLSAFVNENPVVSVISISRAAFLQKDSL